MVYILHIHAWHSVMIVSICNLVSVWYGYDVKKLRIAIMLKSWCVVNSSFKLLEIHKLAHMWTTYIIISHRWTTHITFQYQVNHIMFQGQVNHISINLNLTLYYICIEIMLQKLSCHMAIIQNSGSKSTSMCIWTKSYIYVSPLYIYSSYTPFRYRCQFLWRGLAFFSNCSLVIPIIEQEG